MRSRSHKWLSRFNFLGAEQNRSRRERRRKSALDRRYTLESLEGRDLLTAVVVNSINDDSTPIAGQTTLRDAVNAINASTSSSNTISFDPTVFGSAQTITLAYGPLNITNNVTITGSAAGVTVNGNNQSRVFVIGNNGSVAGFSGTAAPTVELADLTISGGYTNYIGGGILNLSGSSLTVLDSTISNNLASGDGGGGVYNYFGTLAMTNCTLTGNVGFDGGALKNYFGTSTVATLTDCTIVGNKANDGGGGIDTYGRVVLNNSIVANNTSSNQASDSFYIQSPGVVTGSNDLVYDKGNGGAVRRNAHQQHLQRSQSAPG
jgi:hypothetical protein